jgi:tetratricopeptide (TPR) repeat protein
MILCTRAHSVINCRVRHAHRCRSAGSACARRTLRSAFAVGCALAVAACSAPAPHYNGKPVPAVSQAAVPARPDPAKGDPEQRFQVALKLMKDHQTQEAQAAFAALAQDYPQYAGPLDDLGVLQAQGRQRDQAIASFARAVAADGGNAFAYGWLGILYRENGDYARAEQSYRKAIGLKPDAPAPHLNLAILDEQYLHRSTEALVQYREYQRLAGSGANPMVAVWIKQLEATPPPPAQTPTLASNAMAARGAMP